MAIALTALSGSEDDILPIAEQKILGDLISKWVSLGLAYSNGAPGITALYIFAASEDGSSYADFFFEQDGAVDYPSRLEGVETSTIRVDRLHTLQTNDLFAAEDEFRAAGAPLPTEYRVSYETNTGKLDVQISRDFKYRGEGSTIMERGPREWLGSRLPDIFDPNARSK
jgi:hypothetical protein